jgi:hypothetical protein
MTTVAVAGMLCFVVIIVAKDFNALKDQLILKDLATTIFIVVITVILNVLPKRKASSDALYGTCLPAVWQILADCRQPSVDDIPVNDFPLIS